METATEFMMRQCEGANIDDVEQILVVRVKRDGAVQFEAFKQRLTDTLGVLEFVRTVIKHRLQERLFSADDIGGAE